MNGNIIELAAYDVCHVFASSTLPRIWYCPMATLQNGGPGTFLAMTSHLPNYVNNTAFLCFTSLSMKTHKCVITTAGSAANCILESPTLKISRGNVPPHPSRSSCLRHERCKPASRTSVSDNSKYYRKPCLVISNWLSPMRHVRQIAHVQYIKF